MKRKLFRSIVFIAFAFISSCATPAQPSGNPIFRYNSMLAVAGGNVLVPVSVVGVNDGVDRGGNNDPNDSSRFDVTINQARTTVVSPDGNTMSNPQVKEVKGVLQLTWDEIDDYHTGVTMKYNNGSISQMKL